MESCATEVINHVPKLLLQRGTPLAIPGRDASFAARDLRLTDRSMREPIPGSFPRNRFDYLVAKVFIDGVVNRTPLDRTAVLQIANDASVIAPAYSRREWDGAPQSDYLHTVDLLLLVDAREEAQAMVDSARSMRALNIKELFEIDKLILKSSTPVQDDVTAKQTYRRIFDLLRDPTYPDGLRGHPSNLYQGLIMACMWQKFFEPGDGHYDYDKAIDLLWE